MRRVLRNDKVKVIRGKDAGKEGRVVRVYPDRGRALVEGVNRVTVHERVRISRRGDHEGGLRTEEAPVPLDNLMPVCSSCDEPTRVGHRHDDGERVRVCRRCGEDL